MKKLVFACFMGLSFLAVLEVLSYLVLRIEGISGQKIEINYSLIDQEWRSFQAMSGRKVPAHMDWLPDYAPHPYFGVDQNARFTNGLDDLFLPLLGEPKSDEVRIAILGGSVANQWAQYVERTGLLAELIQKEFPNIRVKLLRLSIDGGKQPQQFFIATAAIQQFDIAINIDGLNEVSFSPFPEYPISYPKDSHYYFPRGSHYLEPLARSFFLASLLNGITPEGRSSYHSRFYYLTWLVMQKTLTRLFAFKGTSPFFIEIKDDQFVRQDVPGYEEKTVKLWEELSDRQNKVCKTFGKACFFFLQPNQYASDLRTFSREEQGLFNGPPRYLLNTKFRFERLRLAGARLVKRGVPFFDLSGVFDQEPNPIYKDECCHVNDLGNKLITLAIYKHIKMASPFSRKKAKAP